MFLKIERLHQIYLIKKNHTTEPNSFKYCFECKKKNNKIYNADALVSKRDDLLLGILTADCAPIIVLGLEMFGIIHAGWRGVFNGIIENTIEKFISNGEKENNIKIYVGPHLKKTSFEVKDDFIQDLKKNVYNFEDYISLEEKKKLNSIFPD